MIKLCFITENQQSVKSYRVGVLTEHFIKWGGGIDFIRLIIKGLNILKSDEDKQRIILYILVPKQKKIETKLKNTIKLMLNIFFGKKFILYKEINIKQIISAFKEVDETITICFYKDLDKDLKKQSLKNNLDFIIPAFAPLPENFPIPWIGYLYDFQHKYYPQFFSELEQKRRDDEFSVMLNTAEVIIVNAKSVKGDINRFIGTTKAKVVCLPFCPVLNAFDIEQKIDIDKYKLPEKYFIISNQFWKHKDHLTAIKGFKLFLETINDEKIGLVCTGQTMDSRFPNYFDEIKKIIVQLGLLEKVFILGYLPKRDQLQILRNSIAVIQPTLFEGGPGGFAVYESVAFGIPSIVSDIKVNLELDDETITFFKTSSSIDLSRKMKYVYEKPRKVYSPDELIAKNELSLVQLGRVILSAFENNF